jgi:hypothetical protein
VNGALSRLEGTAAAAAVPPAVGPVVPNDADDDRTALAGDDGTMLAPAGVAFGAADKAGGMAASVPFGGVAPRSGPAIVPPRRRAQSEPRTGTPPLVWALLALAILGAVAALLYAVNTANQHPTDRPLTGLPDSAQMDTTRTDSLTVVDAPRVDRQGFELLKQGQYGQAADLFRQAMDLDPTRAEYKDHLAFALINQQQFTEAIALLEQATRQDPNYDLSYSHLGNARLAVGDTLGAVVALRRFLDVSVNQRDRAEVQRRLTEITTPRPPPDTIVIPVDTTSQAPNNDEPRDSIRIGPPE